MQIKAKQRKIYIYCVSKNVPRVVGYNYVKP